jgi:hypothetical protein
MLSHRAYGYISRIAALVIGAGSLSWSASDPERLRVMLGECEGLYCVGPSDECPDCVPGFHWRGCETLAREVLVGGVLLILAALPIKRPDKG